MSDESIYAGYWWLPQEPDLRLPGTLSHSRRGGIRLALNGNFPEKNTFDPYGLIILGETSFGELITAYQAFRIESTWPAHDQTKGTSSFVADKAFVGCHFPSRGDAKFQAISFHPTHLDHWLRVPVLNVGYQDTGFTVTYDRPQQRTFPIGDDLEISIGFASTGPNLSSALNSVTFEQHAVFVIRKANQDHFNYFADVMSHLDNFLSLAVMAPVYPLELDGYLAASGKDAERPEPIKVLLTLYDVSDDKEIHFSEMLFSYADVSDRLDHFIPNWLTKKEGLEPIFDLFFSVTHNSHAYPVQTFLNYVQALETYHMRTKPNDAYHPTLAQRLRELIQISPQTVYAMVGDPKPFIQRVKNSRNYYTHYNPALKDLAETGGRLKGLSSVLGTMLEAVLLLEMGFSLDEVQRRQQNRRRLPLAWY